MPQSAEELGRLRDILAALEEEESHDVGLGTVIHSTPKNSTCSAYDDDSGRIEDEASIPSPTRAHATYSHFVKEHLLATENCNKTNNIASTNLHRDSTNNAANTIDHTGIEDDQPSSSMLSQELARLKIEYDVWHLRGPHLEARYADAAARIATRSVILKASLTNWGVVGLECPPLAIPEIQRPSTFSTSIGALQHTSPPKLWLRSVHGPDTATPPTATESNGAALTTTTATSSSPSLTPYCISQRGQVATSEAVQSYIELERLREEVGYWKLLDSVLSNTLIPEEKRIELGFRDLQDMEALAGGIRRVLWDGVWLRVASTIQSEQQRIQMFMTHVPTSRIGAASTTCVDAAKLATRDAEKRTLYALQLHHYKSVDVLSHKRIASSTSYSVHSSSRTAAIITTSPSSSSPVVNDVTLPVIRMGGVDDGDVPLYPLTASMDTDLLDKLIRLAEATVWLQSIPCMSNVDGDDANNANNTDDRYDDESLELSRMGLSAVLHLRDGVDRRIQSNQNTPSGSKPATPSSPLLTSRSGGMRVRSFTALPEVHLYLRSLEEDIDDVLATLRSEGERGAATSPTPRWFVGSHNTVLSTTKNGISSPLAVKN